MTLLSHRSAGRRNQDAFTLIEALIVTATMVIVIGSVILCNLFGLSMAVRQQIWMGASDDACRTVSTLMQDIRGASTLQVGSYTSNVFSPTPDNTNQTGNALLIFPTSNTVAPFTLYYFNSVSNTLVRTNFISAGVAGDFKQVSANQLTNDHPLFSEVSCTNTVLTNSRPMATISIYLSFTKLQDPQVVIETGSLVDLYQIVLCVSPRTDL